jgi:hypothetical protein
MAKKKDLHEHYTTKSVHHGNMKKEHLDAIASSKAAAIVDTNSAFHKGAAAHHAAMEEHYSGMAECEKSEKVAGADDLIKALPGNLGELIKALVASELEKALNQLQPLGISTVAPTRPGIVAVPRNGQQAIPIKPIDPMLEKIIGTSDEDESMHRTRA